MLTHYLKIALRNMRRFKLQTIVCLTGLAVGMTCFALGTLWLRYIESFEDFVPDAENVYLASEHNVNSNGGYFYFSSYSTGDALRARPEIKDVCTVSRQMPTVVRDAGGRDFVMDVVYGDSAFFRMFGIEAVEGSLARLRPQEVVLTKEIAKRLFGDSPAVGRLVTMGHAEGKAEEEIDDRCRYTVAAVVRHLPHNTQFGFDAVTLIPESQAHMKENIGEVLANIFHTFAHKHAAANIDSLTQKYNMFEFSTFHEDGRVSSTFNTLLRLLPLRQLRTEFQRSATVIQTNYVRWFVMLGVLVIACALCNYLITMITRLRIREREFALRRVNGASRLSIYAMLSVETLLLFLVSGALGWCLTWLVLPAFREYSGIDLPVGNIALEVWFYLLAVTAVGLLSMLLTAAFVIRRSNHNILYTRTIPPRSGGQRGAWGLIVQLALAMAIVFCSTVIMLQIRHISYSGEIGFNVNRTVLVNCANTPLRRHLQQSPLVEESLVTPIAAFPTLEPPVKSIFADSIKAQEYTDYKPLMVETADRSWAYVLPIDSQTVRFLGYQIIDGRLPLSGSTKVGERKVREACITESVARRFGLLHPVGKKLYRDYDEEDYEIVGLVKDLYFSGATQQPDRFLLFNAADVEPDVFVGDGAGGYEWGYATYLRPWPGKEQALLDSLSVWLNGDDLGFEHTGLQNTDQLFQRYMASERFLLNVLWAVAAASMFVCVVGAFSLISLSLEERRKEIAIRKVHGALLSDILRLFLRTHILSLLLAALVAYPVAYIVMKQWLEGYAKQVGIDWWLIPATFLSISTLVLSTITLKIWRAAKENPVEALNS